MTKSEIPDDKKPRGIKKYFDIHGPVFWPSTILLFLFIAITLIVGSPMERVFSNMQDWISNNSAEKIYTQAVDDGADLIIIGTKGQPGSVISLLGNITENLMYIDTEIPVMIIKNHNKKGFWGLFGS